MSEPGVEDFYFDPIDQHRDEKRLREFLRIRNRRDRFAAAALQGLLASETPDFRLGHATAIGDKAAKLADALIAALEKKP